MYACINDHYSIVEQLYIKESKTYNNIDKNDYSALMYAVVTKNVNIV